VALRPILSDGLLFSIVNLSIPMRMSRTFLVKFQNLILKRICHSEGATRGGLMAEKKIFSDTLPGTTVTEDSPVAIWQGEILRRPENQWQLTDGIVGLLRMTSKGDLSF
jgi:hypothetical protein